MAVQTDMLAYFEDEMIDAFLLVGLDGSYDSNGEWVEAHQAEVPIRIIAPQPVNGKELDMLPQGEHTRNFLATWTKETVETREYLKDADRLRIESAVFKCFVDHNRKPLGNYHKLFIREMRDDN